MEILYGYAARSAHDAKIAKYDAICEDANVKFFPLAWETTGGATTTVHNIIQRWTKSEAERCNLSAGVLKVWLYRRLSVFIQHQNALMVFGRLPEVILPDLPL